MRDATPLCLGMGSGQIFIPQQAVFPIPSALLLLLVRKRERDGGRERGRKGGREEGRKEK